ncbi:DUF502 domain-containing protein [Rudanella paleaurantiibacter]|uniref:DUF502 domain-containing protein n=1 Tax=Rudanella paleaurantiibacter TaxID=2614655 RepID=A0A7J5TZQ6_9BACT|nr:DUF502 domain-containing protein [Rudanella paleaurantiibacter]KAB7730930.1 DUF502 domain-containing protein [Rudanella paleaurantiibacter]
MIRKLLNRTITYFGRGLLAVAPIGLTIWIIYGIFEWVDGLNPIDIPGIGVLIMVGIIFGVGVLVSTIIPQSFATLLEGSIKHLPLVSLMYFSLKDLISAFVGDRKKFNQPVLVLINRQSELRKLGFITQTDLSHLQLHNMVAVYMPHSYAFSGELFIVPAENVTLLNVPSADVMKMIVSGGVSANTPEPLEAPKRVENVI